MQILGALLGVFDGGLLNKPEYRMIGILSTSGRVEITLFAGPSCIVLIGELKYQFKEQDASDVLAQMICEAEGILSSKILTHQGQTIRISKLVLERHQSIVWLLTFMSGDSMLWILKHVHSRYNARQD